MMNSDTKKMNGHLNLIERSDVEELISLGFKEALKDNIYLISDYRINRKLRNIELPISATIDHIYYDNKNTFCLIKNVYLKGRYDKKTYSYYETQITKELSVWKLLYEKERSFTKNSNIRIFANFIYSDASYRTKRIVQQHEVIEMIPVNVYDDLKRISDEIVENRPLTKDDKCGDLKFSRSYNVARPIKCWLCSVSEDCDLFKVNEYLEEKQKKIDFANDGSSFIRNIINKPKTELSAIEIINSLGAKDV